MSTSNKNSSLFSNLDYILFLPMDRSVLAQTIGMAFEDLQYEAKSCGGVESWCELRWGSELSKLGSVPVL